MKITIGIPAFNEEKNIGKIIAQLQTISDSIIVCNDGSNDMTGEIAKKMGVIVIEHQKNLGYGSAIKSIFLKTKEIETDILVTFDADGQHRVDDISSVIEPIINQNYDLVIGSRFLEKPKNIPNYRKFGIMTITKVTNFLTKTRISDSQSGFRAYKKNILNSIIPQEKGMSVSTEILIKATKLNLKVKEVPIIVSYDGNTSKHNPVSHGTSVLFNTIKFVSIDRPLSFYGIPGIILFGIGLFFLLWTLQIFSESRQVVTNIALVGASSISIGLILIMTSIILFSVVYVIREKKEL